MCTFSKVRKGTGHAYQGLGTHDPMACVSGFTWLLYLVYLINLSPIHFDCG
jgi:hypothetical protein